MSYTNECIACRSSLKTVAKIQNSTTGILAPEIKRRKVEALDAALLHSMTLPGVTSTATSRDASNKSFHGHHNTTSVVDSSADFGRKLHFFCIFSSSGFFHTQILYDCMLYNKPQTVVVTPGNPVE